MAFIDQQPYPMPPGTPGYPQPVVMAGGYAPPPQQVIMMQPIPQPNPNIPPGLEFLSILDQLIVKQKIELVEAFIGFETNNKYTVKAGTGQNVFYAVEDNDCCTRNCCGALRPFDMKIFDGNSREVIHISRPLRCDSCCCPCCLQSIEVSAPPGNVVGYVRQNWNLCSPSFTIENAAGEPVLQISGPCCTCKLCGSVEFDVMSRDGEIEVGKISKQWSGLAREYFTDTDNFGISFPLDLDIKIKAVMLGACFLIDFMYFESEDKGSSFNLCTDPANLCAVCRGAD